MCSMPTHTQASNCATSASAAQSPSRNISLLYTHPHALYVNLSLAVRLGSRHAYATAAPTKKPHKSTHHLSSTVEYHAYMSLWCRT
jgi:hypothetical protein